MNKLIIAAVAAALLGSTSASFAESDYNQASSIVSQQIAQPNTLRNAQAQLVTKQNAVKQFTANEAALFARQDVQTAN